MRDENRHVLLYYTGLFCGLVPLANLLNLAVNIIFDIEPSADVGVNTNLSVVFLFVSVCIIPAVLEEVLFRGLIQRFLMRFGAVRAIIITSLIFASLHMQGVLSVFILSLALSVAMWLFKNLKFVIILHLFNNCFAFILYLLSYYLDGNSAFVFSLVLHATFVLLSLIAAVSGRKNCQNQIIIIWKKRCASPKKL